MNHKYFSKIAMVMIVCVVYLIAVGNVFACVCPSLTICQTYTFAEAVFVGKVEKIEKAIDSKFDAQNVTFTVAKAYKGNLGKTEVVQFLSGNGKDCGNLFKIGETYFVYKEEPLRPCNRTYLLKYMPRDVEYAESLSKENPVFFINGRLDNNDRGNLTADELKNTSITIEKGENQYNAEFDKYGNFKFKATETGVYRLKIMLPFEAEIRRGDGYGGLASGTKVTATSTQTYIEYDAEFKPNGCDSRWFAATKTSKSE